MKEKERTNETKLIKLKII